MISRRRSVRRRARVVKRLSGENRVVNIPLIVKYLVLVLELLGIDSKLLAHGGKDNDV